MVPMANEVTLHGARLSPFTCRVIWALELKNIPYQFIEENTVDKSPLLLQYNPVHKKIPVLVHHENPICESMIILEYIDETWPENPLLPSDPFQRSVARFWIKFFEDKVILPRSIQKKKTNDSSNSNLEVLKTVEEHGLVGGGKFFGGDEINMVDLAYGVLARWLPVIEEVVDVKLLEPDLFPRLHVWAENFRSAAVVRDSLPEHGQMVPRFKLRREQLLQIARRK